MRTRENIICILILLLFLASALAGIVAADSLEEDPVPEEEDESGDDGGDPDGDDEGDPEGSSGDDEEEDDTRKEQNGNGGEPDDDVEGEDEGGPVVIEYEGDVLVKVVFSEDRLGDAEDDEIIFEGTVTCYKKVEEEVEVFLEVHMEEWIYRIHPNNMTFTENGERIRFTLIIEPEEGSEPVTVQTITVSGTWECDGHHGEVLPDTVEAGGLGNIRQPTGGENQLVLFVIIGAVAAGTAAGVGSVLTSEWFRYKWAPVLIPLYSRFKRDQVLSHHLRSDLMDKINEKPGIHLEGLSLSANEHRATIMYHLKVLEREALIKSERDGKYRRFYPMDAVPAREAISINRTEERVLEEIRGHPGIPETDISVLLGISRQVVNYHVKKLSQRGAIWVERKGRKVHCYPNERVVAEIYAET